MRLYIKQAPVKLLDDRMGKAAETYLQILRMIERLFNREKLPPTPPYWKNLMWNAKEAHHNTHWSMAMNFIRNL